MSSVITKGLMDHQIIILEEYVKCDNDERRVDGRPPKAGGRLVILKKSNCPSEPTLLQPSD